MDQHGARLPDNLRHLLDLVQVLPDHAGVDGAQIGENLVGKREKNVKNYFCNLIFKNCGKMQGKQVAGKTSPVRKGELKLGQCESI